MCNLMNAMHGGCTAFLVDMCVLDVSHNQGIILTFVIAARLWLSQPSRNLQKTSLLQWTYRITLQRFCEYMIVLYVCEPV